MVYYILYRYDRIGLRIYNDKDTDMLKVLHTGDLHLDAPFASVGERQAQIRKNEMRAAFTSMMTYARMNGIDVVLMAGDVFDGPYVTGETLQLFCKELEKFPGMVFVSPGNHDPADMHSVWRRTAFPKNVHIFLEQTVTSFDIPDKNCTVWGYGFTGKDLYESPIEGCRVEDAGKINLLVCHCDTQTDSSNAPVKEDVIRDFGADYTAMGHWHNPPQPGERWAYCGCLEPRDFTENGPKGACVVEIDKNGETSTVRMKRVRFSKRRYETGKLDISGCSTMDDVRRMTRAWLDTKKYGEDVLLSLRYTGHTAETLVINPDLLGDMGLFCLKIEDKTTPFADMTALAKDSGIRGAFYRTLEPMLSSTDPAEKDTAMRALRYGLAAMAGENIVG